MKASPTARSTEYLREHGFIVTKVEQVLPGPYAIKKDAFGFGDLLIARRGFGAALVQVTDTSNVGHRVNKILGIADDKRDPKNITDALKAKFYAEAWLQSGNRIFVHGWALRGPRGQEKVWTLREIEIIHTRRGMKPIEAPFFMEKLCPPKAKQGRRA